MRETSSVRIGIRTRRLSYRCARLLDRVEKVGHAAKRKRIERPAFDVELRRASRQDRLPPAAERARSSRGSRWSHSSRPAPAPRARGRCPARVAPDACAPSGVRAESTTRSTMRSNSQGAEGSEHGYEAWDYRVIDHTGDASGAVAVVDVHDRDAIGARVEHAEQRGDAAEAGAVADAGRHRDHRHIDHTGHDARQRALHAGDDDDHAGGGEAIAFAEHAMDAGDADVVQAHRRRCPSTPL